MSIEIKNLTKKYNDQIAVNNISLNIDTNEVVGFIGPNGAGKTTTMKIITGYIDKFEGEVLINGLDVRTHSLEVRRQIGYLPEHNPLYTDLYIREYLTFIANIYKIPNKKSRIDDVIQATGLTKECHKKINMLSKGYRQRVGLAAAIIHDPQVLILDEPTTGLDPNQIIEIRNLIASLGNKKTVMLSTHIMQEVEAICSKVVILNKGQIIVNDQANKVNTYSENKQTVIFVEFQQDLDLNILHSIENVIEVENIDNKRFVIYSNSDIRSEIFKFAVANNYILLSMNIREKNLETMFHELTEK